ncbi:hypothetical protein B0T24DRAFT_126510 [Lasiosphaeria ovina]|uniref:Uncharacterized protein n=1 Tax=Lasiosphaeria ovina TaxID=92902 RepID=A0AAE0JSE8_9PEZI|nr:hypothetical protein B0T24DRAFT_126510 [Lasiosphaeria ovina]
MRFSVSGPLPEVARLIQQLAWITAAFEPPKKNVLTVSTAFVDIVPGMIDIRPRELDSQALLRGPSDSKANASCWHQLLPGAVLAYGFPISERKEGIGLEIPFDFMVSLADIRTKIDVAEGVTLLGGPEILLYPTQILECGVQWHCTEIDGNRSGEHGQVPTGALPNQSLQDLSNRRAFLGFWTKSQVLLGTQDLVETLRARKDLESRFKKAPGGIELAREAIFSAGFSFNAQASIGVKAVFSRTLQVSLEEGRTYFDLVDKAAVQPTIIYDEQTKSGWVISEMSLALHVALSYLSNPRVQERRHSGPEPLEGDWPQLPFAEPCADGGSEARRICIESTNCQIKLWSENGKTKTFCKVIEDVLRDFRAIKTATLAQNRQSGWRPEFMRPGLRGWEYSEFVSRESVIFQKEVPFKGHEAPWWELERVDGMLAFFGRGLGELIKPMHSSRHPSGLSAIPPGSRLLVASRPCLENNLKGAAEKGKRLVGSLEWTSATAKRYCNDACDTTSCLSIQILGRTSSSSGTSPNRQVLDAEVIMFGEPEYYHKALIEQKARRGNSWNG